MVTPTYGKGITAQEYMPNEYAIWNPSEMSMIGKIAYQVIRGVTAHDPLAVFDKMPVNTGDTIEQVVVRLVESQAFDKDGLNALKPDKRDKLAVRYFKDWNEKTFKTTVRYNDLRMVSDTVENKDRLAELLVSELGQSDIYEKFQNIKGLLEYGSTAVSGVTPLKDLGTVLAKNGTVDYLGVLTQIKNTVKGMSYVSDSFNTSGLKTRTVSDDIFIIAPYELITSIDVESLSGVFNLDKAEIRNHIIEIDTPKNADGNYTVYVVDRNALLVVTQLYIMQDEKNASGNFWNYYLHVNRMYAISSLFNGAFFKVATQTAA